ncbi:MAG: ADP-ribosylglycohydrolase family protein, partial [Planctomycetota bacterium]
MASDRSLKALLRPRFRGTILGGAIGDALGFPFEGTSRSFMVALGDDITDSFAKHRSGYFPQGQYSDDTQMTIATVEAILKAERVDGRAIADAFVPLWRENRIIGRGNACSEAIQRLIDGTADWRSSGAEEGRAGNGAAMRAAPIGLWDYDQPERLIVDGEIAASITHHDPSAIAGAAAVAAGVAYNLTHREVILGDLLDAVSGAAGRFDAELASHIRDLPRYLSLPGEKALEEISTLGLSGPYRETREGITPSVVPTVLIALYYFLRTPTQYVDAVRNCLLVGGDVDTTASVVGSLSGALNGIEGIPEHL